MKAGEYVTHTKFGKGFILNIGYPNAQSKRLKEAIHIHFGNTIGNHWCNKNDILSE